MKRIAIVGGGASGVISAIALANASFDCDIHIYEPAAKLAEGVAYSTTDPAHRLNVPTSNMSALAEDKAHLVRWTGLPDWSFLPRREYAEYLRNTLATVTTENSTSYQHIRETVTSAKFDGGFWHVQTDDTNSVRVYDFLILATGWGERKIEASQPKTVVAWRHEPIEWCTYQDIGIVGNGLTAVDYILTALGANPRSKVTTYSRHGLTPLAHELPTTMPVVPDNLLYEPSLFAVIRYIRSAGAHWRAAFDSLRPVTASIWRKLSPDQRELFLSRLLRYWDVHRHRMAPEVAEQIREYELSGRLTHNVAYIKSLNQTPTGVQVLHADGSSAHELIVLATGARFDIAGSPILTDLQAQELLVPDLLGIKSDPETGQAVDANDVLVPQLYTVGPLRRGVLFESTAIPEIRTQAARLATILKSA